MLWVAQAKRDHFDFVTKMRERDIDVLEMHNLLTDIVGQKEALDWILERKLTANQVGLGLVHEVGSWLRSLEPRKVVAEFLIGGVSADDLPDSFGGKTLSMFRDFLGHSSFILPPLPNTQFTRDTTCWIYGGVTLNPMYWPAAPGNPVGHRHLQVPPGIRQRRLPGLVRRPGSGPRQRHPRRGRRDADRQRRGVDRHHRSEERRAAMHLDTVFSFCDRDLVTIFPEVVNQIVAFSLRPDESKPGGIDVRREETGFLDTVAKALGLNALRVVETGGNSFAAEREQCRCSDRLRPQHLHQHPTAQGRRRGHHHQCR